MTSGRIEGYKDYRDLMNKHSRADRLRKAYRLFLIVLGTIALLFFSYLFFVSPEDKIESKTSEIGVLNNQETFYVNSIAGDTIDTKDGSIIYIPKNAFTKNGKLIIGKVKVLYQEYRNPIDIALANIEMSYNDGYLESAGMFSFHALQGKDTLSPSTDSSSLIQVHFKSKIYDTNFQQYKLDDNKNWELVGDQKTLVPFKILGNYNDYPELEVFKGVDWVLDMNINIPAQLISDRLFKYTGTDPVIEFDSIVQSFSLSMSYLYKEPDREIGVEESNVFELKIKPLSLGNKDINKVYNQYLELLAKRNDWDSQVKLEDVKASKYIMSSFSLTNFSTWNIDKPLPNTDYISINPIFVDSLNRHLNTSQIIAISDSLNTVFRFENNLKLKSNSTYTLFFVTPNKDLYFSKVRAVESLKSITFKKIRLNIINTVTIADALDYEYKEPKQTALEVNEDYTESSQDDSPKPWSIDISIERPEAYKNKNVIWFMKQK